MSNIVCDLLDDDVAQKGILCMVGLGSSKGSNHVNFCDLLEDDVAQRRVLNVGFREL